MVEGKSLDCWQIISNGGNGQNVVEEDKAFQSS